MNKFLGTLGNSTDMCVPAATECYIKRKSVTLVQDKLFVGINQELTEACCTGKASPDGKE